jgi:hypothetical protein
MKPRAACAGPVAGAASRICTSAAADDHGIGHLRHRARREAASRMPKPTPTGTLHVRADARQRLRHGVGVQVASPVTPLSDT